MKTQGITYSNGQWEMGNINQEEFQKDKSIILLFLDRLEFANNNKILSDLKNYFPDIDITTISTGGSITNESTMVDSPYAVLMHLEKSVCKSKLFSFSDYTSEQDMGQDILKQSLQPDLKHILIFTVGNEYNIGNLLQGLNEDLPEGVSISGGIAGDGNRFEEAIVGFNDTVDYNTLVAISFYGEDFHVNTTFRGGWKPFGPTRTVTKSEGNILYEIDGKPALDLYKKYLGEEYTNKLPESALLFPLQVQREEDSEPIARTVLSIDEASKSMNFAGDIPQETPVRLMRTNLDEIIMASGQAIEENKLPDPDCSLLISCIGRRLILEHRTEEEIEEVRNHLPNSAFIFGFYSYGEISMNNLFNCEVYNQTMTITSFSEK